MTKYVSLNYSLIEDEFGYPTGIGLSCQEEFLEWIHNHPFTPEYDYYPNSPEDGPSENEFSENGYYSAEETEIQELLNHMKLQNYPEGIVQLYTEAEYKRKHDLEVQEYKEYMEAQYDRDMGEMYGNPIAGDNRPLDHMTAYLRR